MATAYDSWKDAPAPVDSRAERVTARIAEIVEDTVVVAELIGDSDHAWLGEAVAHAYRSDDWAYVQREAERHLEPAIRAVAEADVDEEIAQADEARSEALGWAQEHAA